MTSTAQTWDITPNHADYSGPNITLTEGRVYTARADDPRVDPWVLIPVTMLQYIDTACIKSNGDRAAAFAYNEALIAAFPEGLPGAGGGFIDMGEPDVDPWPGCALHGNATPPCTCPEYTYDTCREEHPGQTHDEWNASFDDAQALAWYRATYDDDQTSDDLVLARCAAWARGQSLGPDAHGIPRRPGGATGGRPF